MLDPEGVVGGAVGIDSGVGDLGVDGAPIVGLRGVDCVGGVRDGVIGVVADADDDDGKMQDPELGLVLTKVAAPPKSQLVGAGFF